MNVAEGHMTSLTAFLMHDHLLMLFYCLSPEKKDKTVKNFQRN